MAAIVKTANGEVRVEFDEVPISSDVEQVSVPYGYWLTLYDDAGDSQDYPAGVTVIHREWAHRAKSARLTEVM